MDQSICVYCASSQKCDPSYHDAARRLGEILAARGDTIIYGGGALGSMGALAEGALARGGRIIGIMPKFMQDLEWGHPGLTELRVVEDMRTRKHLMLSEAQGCVTLPGGSGTFEELFEAITLKRLGLYTHPIILVNTNGYFARMIEMLQFAVTERFLDERHLSMWSVVSTPDEVPAALEAARGWSIDAREFAVVR
jgi:uncharacterized protein (TIGR00730 family)